MLVLDMSLELRLQNSPFKKLHTMLATFIWRFYSKQLTVHVCALGFEPTPFALLTHTTLVVALQDKHKEQKGTGMRNWDFFFSCPKNL